MKNLLLFLAFSTTTGLTMTNVLNNHNNSNVSTTINNNVLVGYWHNWDNATGYQGGNAKYMDLTAVPSAYNVIDVSFLKANKDGEIPDFKPEMPNHEELTQEQKDQLFTKQIDLLHNQHRVVILSLGGALGHLALHKDQTSDFTNKIRSLINKYHFDGIDIDLESISVQAADNVNVISDSLKQLKEEYGENGKHFYITMAPEFPNLKNAAPGSYVPYIKNLENYYDFINPQFYNQAGDGVSPTQTDKDYFLNKYGIDTGWWLPQTQSNPKLTSVFLALIIKYIVTGETVNGFKMIPANKLVLGLPANKDAAANGLVTQVDLTQALFYLKNLENNNGSAIKIKGLMTWSVNWDQNTNFEFMKMYESLFSN